MIKNNNKSISSVYNETTVIGKIIKGTLLVWEAFRKLIVRGIPPLTLLNCKGVDLVDYKIYGNSVQGKLPNEYQQVEYIEGTGTQYTIIDYIATGITSSKGKYQITDTSKARFLFGSRGASGTNFYGLNWGGGAPFKYYNSYKEGLVTTLEIDDKIHTFYKNKGALYIDDTYIQARSDLDFITPYKMNVFACNNDGVAGYLPVYAKLYNLQFYDNDVLMVDLIPCYRKSDNEIGLYDLVNDVFYTNNGTGTFLKGSDTPTPNTPIEVESVGNYDEETGKYKIPVKVIDELKNETITNIYLNQPLYKIGDYADYIDFEKGKVIRPIKKLDLKKAGGAYDWQSKRGVVFYAPNMDTAYFRNELCLSNVNTAFSLKDTQTATSGMWMGVNNGNIYWLGVLDVLGLSTYSELNEWLKNNPVYVLYVSSLEPVEEEIELPNIPTHKGTTIIEVDTTTQPSNMEVEYYGKN